MAPTSRNSPGTSTVKTVGRTSGRRHGGRGFRPHPGWIDNALCHRPQAAVSPATTTTDNACSHRADESACRVGESWLVVTRVYDRDIAVGPREHRWHNESCCVESLSLPPTSNSGVGALDNTPSAVVSSTLPTSRIPALSAMTYLPASTLRPRAAAMSAHPSSTYTRTGQPLRSTPADYRPAAPWLSTGLSTGCRCH